jgi:hypothetical protein
VTLGIQHQLNWVFFFLSCTLRLTNHSQENHLFLPHEFNLLTRKNASDPPLYEFRSNPIFLSVRHFRQLALSDFALSFFGDARLFNVLI